MRLRIGHCGVRRRSSTIRALILVNEFLEYKLQTKVSLGYTRRQTRQVQHLFGMMSRRVRAFVMQDDLLPARASVDWVVAQLPSFQARLDTWLSGNIQTGVKELPPDVPNNLIVAIEKEPLPTAFQVEAGAYINTIRSSLDILAATLAQRHCPALIDDAYFPVVGSSQIFSDQRYKGHKLIQSLPSTERARC
jgi:hypothetical protein